MVYRRAITVILAVALFAAATVTPARSQSGLSDGLVACWSLDEPDGPRADLVNFHHLTDVNTVGYGGGKISNAAYFVAANTESLQRNVASDPALFPSQWTISFWFYPVAGYDSSYIWGYGNAIGIYGRYYDSTDKFRFSLGSGNIHDTVATYAPGQWYLVTFFIDSGTMGIKINNNTAETWSHTATLSGYTTLYIGYGSTSYIDNLAYWNRILDDGEIDDYYNAGNGVSCADVLDDGGGGGPVVTGPLGSTYDVDLPSGGTGVIEMYSTAGELGTMGGLAVLITITMFRVIQATVAKGRAK
jgi:hypothetical protein